MTRIKNCEYLVDNFISSGLRKALQPMNFIQSLFLMSRYRTQDNFITPHGTAYHIISILSKFPLSIFYFLTFTELKYENAFVAVNVINRVGCVVAYIVLTISNVVYGKVNVNLLKEIQKVVGCLKYDESVYLTLARDNWILVLVFATTYISHLLYCILDHFFRQNSYHGTLFVFDVHVIYAASILRIITPLVYSLIDKLRSCIKNSDDCDKENCDFVHMFRMILRVYDLFQTVFKVVVLLYYMQVFFLTMLLVKTSLFVDNVNTKTSHAVFTLIFVFLKWSLCGFLSYHCERLYTAVSGLKTLCLDLKRGEGTLHHQLITKNLLRLTEIHFRKVSACGVFTVEPRNMLSLFGLVATYTVILLQFALL